MMSGKNGCNQFNQLWHPHWLQCELQCHFLKISYIDYAFHGRCILQLIMLFCSVATIYSKLSNNNTNKNAFQHQEHQPWQHACPSTPSIGRQFYVFDYWWENEGSGNCWSSWTKKSMWYTIIIGYNICLCWKLFSVSACSYNSFHSTFPGFKSSRTGRSSIKKCIDNTSSLVCHNIVENMIV